MRIRKKHRNQYARAGDVWVRNPCTKATPHDINNMARGDEAMFLRNEIANVKRQHMLFGDFQWQNIVIVSDGYDFKRKQEILAAIPNKNMKIICVNRALAKWHMLGSSELQRGISLYVTNNPHIECLSYLPKHGYWPNLLASSRTNSDFIDKYEGELFFYEPSKNENYSAPFESELQLDDYRNSICASISLACRLKAQKVLLFCCDDSFEDERPAAIQLDNGLWSYPQQIKAQSIIDAQLGWLAQSEIEVRSHSSGANYKNAAYIQAEDIMQFFSQETNE